MLRLDNGSFEDRGSSFEDHRRTCPNCSADSDTALCEEGFRLLQEELKSNKKEDENKIK